MTTLTPIYGLTNDSTCPFRASPDQVTLQTSWILRLNIIYCTILSIGCFFGVAYCIRYMRKHPIFNESTSLLLYLSLVFAVIHDVIHVCIQVSLSQKCVWSVMYRSFFYADDPCNIFFDADDCGIFGRGLLFGISGMIYIHSALSLDGLLATFLPTIYYRKKYVPGVILAIIMVILVIFLDQDPHFLVQIAFNFCIQFVVLPWENSGKDYVPSCQFFKKQDAGRANYFLISSLLLTILNLVLNLGLLYVNKKHSMRLNYLADDTSSSTAFLDQYLIEYNTPSSYRTRYDVQFQYQRSEAMMTSKSISVLVIAQISALGIYAGGSWMFRQARDAIPVYLYNNLIIWVYALSYATVTLPLLIIFCIRYVRRRRQRTIHHITSHKDCQNHRMDELKALWG
ncbi:CRE-SRA-14 protein [Caenorhabditis remanei]|uniref:CRE-SRA-14 protein n=1 Tax=Caenorhabditis remanei TaxID=31234 RepID=E3MQ02_CAERE|nr:CRE-SRA-14 protein [Caenorhabditis remanei]